MFTRACEVGDVITAITETASYWFVITAPQVAEVFRKGNGEQFAQLLQKRKLGAELVEGEGFGMYDVDDNPITVIIPTNIGKTTRDKIPTRHV